MSKHTSQTTTSTVGARVLSGLYTLFAISAGVRSLYQIAAKFGTAPLAYSLSLTSALVYLVAVMALRRRSPTAWRVTFGVCLFELLGVLIVGTLTVIEPQLFADETVWSQFGQGYGYIPFVLPIAGLLWLLRPATKREYGIG